MCLYFLQAVIINPVNQKTRLRNATVRITKLSRLELIQFLRSNEPRARNALVMRCISKGVRPVIYEHTGWDLAPATLAFDISKHTAECLSDLGKQLPRFCLHAGEHVEHQPEKVWSLPW